MAKTYVNPRGGHVAPGIYTNELEIKSSVKSIGITSLGLVGETVKGRAFEPVNVSNWNEFTTEFGGTNPELFKGSQYPKYELPYIAKSYLEESENLNVVRVLGLSGYNAGPAWIVTAAGDQESGSTKYAVAIIRSRGTYAQYDKKRSDDDCKCVGINYDVQKFKVGMNTGSTTGDTCYQLGFDENALKIGPYSTLSTETTCESGSSYSSETGNWNINSYNSGRFTLSGYTDGNTENIFKYAVSLNPYDKDYILKVLGTNNDDGDAPIFVETLYDVALNQAITSGTVEVINSGLTFVDALYQADYCWHEPVKGLLTIPTDELKRKNVGERYLADSTAVGNGIKYYQYDYTTKKKSSSATTTVNAGEIYTVGQDTTEDGKREYFYWKYDTATVTGTGITDVEQVNAKGIVNPYSATSGSSSTELRGSVLVFNNEDGLYYTKVGDDVSAVTLDMNDYKSPYRYASTPWFVSNLKGDATNIEMNKLFRLHTISDGNCANQLVKASIENIRPDEGTFDVVIRDINDSDEAPAVLERFVKCNLVPGDTNYIALKIGSFDGQYESKSKYVTVEVNESSAVSASVPAGFLGYPKQNFSGVSIAGKSELKINFPPLKYNATYDPEIKAKRQYFGLSTWTGVDIDNFTFKGVLAYGDNPEFLTDGFHLDSRLALATQSGTSAVTKIYVDGETGYTFSYVSPNTRTASLDGNPIIATEAEMIGSVYEDVRLRKFTAHFYGGFDGWDIYRDQRTTGNEFKLGQYHGRIVQRSGEGYAFNHIKNPDLIGLNQGGITSDWYAYLAGVRQFANPDNIDINVLAVPGVDPINTSLLADEVIDMVEEERGDTFYVMGLPDKPNGASDYVTSMYTADEITGLLDASEVTSNYAAVYYPWVKILDGANGQYIYVSPTKDVVRNLALTDNVAFSWYAPAGYSRGTVDCVKAKKNLVIAEEDELYSNAINPIKTFGADGVKIFGQKTLAEDKESLLSRISVRRLLLRVKKLIRNAAIGLIFDPYDSTTKQSFISTVAPILDGVKANRGLVDYRIEVDDSVENRMRYELPCRIFIKPTPTLEYISISFVLTPQNVSFEDVV